MKNITIKDIAKLANVFVMTVSRVLNNSPAVRQAARRQQHMCAFARQHALREGVEATIFQEVRAIGMRRSRSHGHSKTHLQHVGIAAAINVARLIDWLDGTGPAPRQLSAFQRLFFAA